MRIRTWTVPVIVVAIAAASGTPARAGSSIGIHVDISNAPPPPVVVYRAPPRTVYVPEEAVYVVDDAPADCDGFRYGAYWYISRGDYWYRARTWHGPFQVIDTRYVPRAIYEVPARHWRHHPHGMPPGLAKQRAWEEDRAEWHHQRGRGHHGR